MTVPWGRLPSQDTTRPSTNKNNENDDDEKMKNRSSVMTPKQESDTCCLGMIRSLLQLGSKQRLILLNNVAPF